jgi:hypothetical protein
MSYPTVTDLLTKSGVDHKNRQNTILLQNRLALTSHVQELVTK